MSTEHAALCHAAFCTPPLSAGAQLKLLALPSVDWGALWNYFLQHKAQFIILLEQAIQLLPQGAVWTDLLKIIEDLLNPPLPPVPPVPVPPAPVP